MLTTAVRRPGLRNRGSRCGTQPCPPKATIDLRGTPGLAKDVPVGFARVRLRFVDTEKLDQLLKLTERFCIVYQTLKSGAPIAVGTARS
jgi:hypothetical protein